MTAVCTRELTGACTSALTEACMKTLTKEEACANALTKTYTEARMEALTKEEACTKALMKACANALAKEEACTKDRTLYDVLGHLHRSEGTEPDVHWIIADPPPLTRTTNRSIQEGLHAGLHADLHVGFHADRHAGKNQSGNHLLNEKPLNPKMTEELYFPTQKRYWKNWGILQDDYVSQILGRGYKIQLQAVPPLTSNSLAHNYAADQRENLLDAITTLLKKEAIEEI
ncbi:uncharacterized protein LOC124281913 [Haliotis rubra]|uniref:uncharacterized protein LOC124281913 n=1 Tax=Haliotis rubra TaxID=36100 RepID=UPI001EE56D60|nr:uncharacterized protein LOC124281913 [Haliotis rubra]